MKLKIEPTYKQHLALERLFDSVTEFVLFGGGANGGKSWIGCLWLILCCYMYPGTKYFIGREELKRLKDTTLVTFFKVCKYYKIPESDYRFNGQDNNIKFRNASRIDLLDLKFLPSDPLYERFGSAEYTSGWIEEAGEVHFDAFDTLKSRIGRYYNDKFNILGKIFLSCNPKRNWLFSIFYKPFKNNSLPDNLAFIQALVDDNWYREKKSKEKLQGITNKAKRERLLFGNWNYEDEPDQLIAYEWLDKSLEVEHIKGKKALGNDVARFGDDLSVIAKFFGNALILLKYFSGLSTDVFAEKIKEEIDEDNIDSDLVGIDTVGLGAGTYDNLVRWGYSVKEIRSGAAAEDIDIDDEDESSGSKEETYEYNNLRSQMWWVAREELRKGEISIKLTDQQLVERLFEDLTAPKYEIRNDKVIVVESKKDIKKRIGRSPDLGDAFVYGNWMRKERTASMIEFLKW